MSDVAAKAGVSVPTVSKVLNGRGDVSDATRARVLAAMASTGYLSKRLPNPESTGLIDVVIGGIGTPWALEILDGAERAAARRGSAIVVTSTVNESFSMPAWLASVAARRSDGVIFVLSDEYHSEIKALDQLHTRVVLLDPVGGIEPDLAAVGATNWTGGYAAAEHLLAQGHTRIGFIGGPPELECSHQRFEGFAAALRRKDLDIIPELVTHNAFITRGGHESGAHLLDLPERPTAIFASSDLQAAGLYEAARERELKIPSDLSVVGFDDTVVCTYLSPALTSVRQPLADMAAEAVRLIFELNDDSTPARGRRIEMATSLVVRDSTAPLNSR